MKESHENTNTHLLLNPNPHRVAVMTALVPSHDELAFVSLSLERYYGYVL